MLSIRQITTLLLVPAMVLDPITVSAFTVSPARVHSSVSNLSTAIFSEQALGAPVIDGDSFQLLQRTTSIGSRARQDLPAGTLPGSRKKTELRASLRSPQALPVYMKRPTSDSESNPSTGPTWQAYLGVHIDDLTLSDSVERLQRQHQWPAAGDEARMMDLARDYVRLSETEKFAAWRAWQYLNGTTVPDSAFQENYKKLDEAAKFEAWFIQLHRSDFLARFHEEIPSWQITAFNAWDTRGLERVWQRFSEDRRIFDLKDVINFYSDMKVAWKEKNLPFESLLNTNTVESISQANQNFDQLYTALQDRRQRRVRGLRWLRRNIRLLSRKKLKPNPNEREPLTQVRPEALDLLFTFTQGTPLDVHTVRQALELYESFPRYALALGESLEETEASELPTLVQRLWQLSQTLPLAESGKLLPLKPGDQKKIEALVNWLSFQPLGEAERQKRFDRLRRFDITDIQRIAGLARQQNPTLQFDELMYVYRHVASYRLNALAEDLAVTPDQSVGLQVRFFQAQWAEHIAAQKKSFAQDVDPVLLRLGVQLGKAIRNIQSGNFDAVNREFDDVERSAKGVQSQVDGFNHDPSEEIIRLADSRQGQIAQFLTRIQALRLFLLGWKYRQENPNYLLGSEKNQLKEVYQKVLRGEEFVMQKIVLSDRKSLGIVVRTMAAQKENNRLYQYLTQACKTVFADPNAVELLVDPSHEESRTYGEEILIQVERLKTDSDFSKMLYEDLFTTKGKDIFEKRLSRAREVKSQKGPYFRFINQLHNELEQKNGKSDLEEMLVQAQLLFDQARDATLGLPDVEEEPFGKIVAAVQRSRETVQQAESLQQKLRDNLDQPETAAAHLTDEVLTYRMNELNACQVILNEVLDAALHKKVRNFVAWFTEETIEHFNSQGRKNLNATIQFVTDQIKSEPAVQDLSSLLDETDVTNRIAEWVATLIVNICFKQVTPPSESAVEIEDALEPSALTLGVPPELDIVGPPEPVIEEVVAEPPTVSPEPHPEAEPQDPETPGMPQPPIVRSPKTLLLLKTFLNVAFKTLKDNRYVPLIDSKIESEEDPRLQSIYDLVQGSSSTSRTRSQQDLAKILGLTPEESRSWFGTLVNLREPSDIQLPEDPSAFWEEKVYETWKAYATHSYPDLSEVGMDITGFIKLSREISSQVTSALSATGVTQSEQAIPSFSIAKLNHLIDNGNGSLIYFDSLRDSIEKAILKAPGGYPAVIRIPEARYVDALPDQLFIDPKFTRLLFITADVSGVKARVEARMLHLSETEAGKSFFDNLRHTGTRRPVEAFPYDFTRFTPVFLEGLQRVVANTRTESNGKRKYELAAYLRVMGGLAVDWDDFPNPLFQALRGHEKVGLALTLGMYPTLMGLIHWMMEEPWLVNPSAPAAPEDTTIFTKTKKWDVVHYRKILTKMARIIYQDDFNLVLAILATEGVALATVIRHQHLSPQSSQIHRYAGQNLDLNTAYQDDWTIAYASQVKGFDPIQPLIDQVTMKGVEVLKHVGEWIKKKPSGEGHLVFTDVWTFIRNPAAEAAAKKLNEENPDSPSPQSGRHLHESA